LNIGIIHGFVGGGGGTEKTLSAIIEALSETKYNVTLYTFSKPRLSTDKITIKSSLPLSIPAFGLYQRAMESKLISKAKNDDIIIQASGGLSLPTNPQQKIIVYCHNDFKSELEKTNTKYKGLWSIYYKSYYNLVKKFFEKINDPNIYLISNSNYIKNSIKEKYDKDSIVIFPPVDLSEFESSTKQKIVVTVTRFSAEKNLEFALDVMKDISVEYKIIGNTKTKSNVLYYKKLLSKIKKFKMESKLKLLRDIKRSELIKNLNVAKVYFHTSEETFGISVVESIAAGCIPIVPDNSAHIETVPISELRYKENCISEARKKVDAALDGKYDSFQKILKENIKNFSNKNFKKEFIGCIEKISKH